MKLPRTLATAALAALLLAGCTGKNAVDQSGGQYRFVSGTSLGKTFDIAHRAKSGKLTGSLLTGGPFRLATDAGKVVVINFWATWCGPCTTETPQFDSVYRTDKAKGVDFIGVNTKDVRSKVEAFVKDNDISYPIVFDEAGESAISLGKIPAVSLPFTVILDKHQRVAVVYLNKMTAKDLQPLINKLLAES